MKKIICSTMAIATLVLVSCKKDQQGQTQSPSKTIYSDFSNNPITITEGSAAFELDIDKDGVKDFVFKAGALKEDQQSYTYFYVEPLTQNAHQQAIMLDAYSFVSGQTIQQQTETEKYWSNSRGQLLEVDDFGYKVERMGWFNEASKEYLGVRLTREQKNYFGWIEISHKISTDKDQVIITRAAINQTASEGIIAGK